MLADDRLQHLQDAVDDPVGWAFFAGASLLQAGRASLLLRDHGTAQLIVYAAVGIEPAEAATLRVCVGRGVAGVVAERGIILAGEEDGVVFLSLPIVTARGVEGVLEVTDRQGDRQFGDGDIALAGTVAAHIAYQLGKHQIAAEQVIGDVSDRILFEDLLDRELARSRRTGSPLTVAIARLTQTEASVTTSIEGVAVEAISDALRGILRRYDVVGRYAHDSVALLFISSMDAGSGVMQRIAETVAAVIRSSSLDLECRIGIARCPIDGISGAELLSAAGANAINGQRVERILP
jgi:GGDEF domain-containing protein